MSTEEESERRQKQQRPVSSLSAPVVSSDEPRLNGSSNFGGNRSSPMRPKLNTIHSSDASRFMTLERLQHLKPTSTKKHPQIIKDCSAGGQQDRQLTIETAIFPEQQPMFQSEKGWRSSNGGSQSDTKSVRSGSESNTRSPSNKRSAKKSRRRPHHPSNSLKPTEVFAQNLSDAVLDANDSDDEGFVYRDRSSLYPPLPLQWATENTSLPPYYTKKADRHLQPSKPHRPVLRSAVSELPTTGFYYRSPLQQQQPQQQQHSAPVQPYPRYHDWYPSDADEEHAPLLNRGSLGIKRKRRQNAKVSCWKRRRMYILWTVGCLVAAVTGFWSIILFTATPLSSVEVLELANVLGSTKELFFDLRVRARNSNIWSIQISHASFSVFASSHYVPTAADINNASMPPLSGQASTPVEFLGSIYQLDEPLVFAPARLFHPTVSTATSQIQIRNPGQANGDNSGNERWSLLIRYPYELTVRGVLKYRIFPFPGVTNIHSARVCQISRVDPATGDVSNIPESDNSICEEAFMM